MGITINLYTFSKKINSTARPSTVAKSYSCVIKEPCGILNPTISLDMGVSISPASYNYAYIPTFERYYFIREWTFVNALWVASLEVDSMATWKNEIGISSCYVLRSSQEYNLDIQDTTYPGTSKTTNEQQSGNSPWITDSIDNGTYVVGIVGGQCTTYYLFIKEALDLFFDWIFSDAYAVGLVGAEWVTMFPELKAQCNPMQYITHIQWLPFETTGTHVTSIKVGWVDVPVACWRVDGSGIRTGIHDFTIHRHPQEIRGNYLNNAPYTNYRLFYPPWGSIPLDPDIMANSDTLDIIWNIDLRTGQGTLIISAIKLDGATAHIMSWLHTQVGVNYQVSQVLNRGYGVGNLISSALGIGASIASGNVAGAISGGVGAIGDMVHSKVPSATTIGSNGGIDSLRGLPTLLYEFKEVVDEDMTHRGRPLCKVKQINELSGFILVSDADINIPATQEEQNTIRNTMEGGFFYE